MGPRPGVSVRAVPAHYDKFVHSLFAYIPPSPDAGEFRRDFTWLPRTDDFKAAPEFFSLGPNGQRVVNMQLCFGNP